jgi:uncharacterized membrane protein
MEEYFASIHLHPMLVHFPIALFLTALALEVLSLIFKHEGLHKSALHCFIGASIVAPLAFWAGHLEEERLGLHHPVLEWHERLAAITMYGSLLFLGVLFYLTKIRSRYFRVIFLIGLIFFSGAVSLTAYNGGRLVYEYAIGLEE